MTDLVVPATQLQIAVLLPCHNEESAIIRVVKGFQAALPGAVVYVYDNASDDCTAELAAAAGAVVRREDRRGKGNVVCRMFADVDADVYVLADGDGTYDPSAAPVMIDRLVEDNLDMVVGCRVPATGEPRTFPRGHVVGNLLFNRTLKALFGGSFTDVFSGYRVMSRRFVKSFPGRFTGFEIETELVTHTLDIGLPYAEMSTTYRSRDLDSKPKLRTVRDGVRILVAAFLMFKEMRPLRFFSIITAILTALALGLGAIPVAEFIETGLVLHFPTAILAASIQIVAFISLTAGIILDSVCLGRRQAKRLVYLSMPAVARPGANLLVPLRPPLEQRLRWAALSFHRGTVDAQRTRPRDGPATGMNRPGPGGSRPRRNAAVINARCETCARSGAAVGDGR